MSLVAARCTDWRGPWVDGQRLLTLRQLLQWFLLVLSRLQASGLQYLQYMGSVVVVLGLSCSKACGIFPDQRLNRVPCTGGQIVIHCTTRKVQKQSGLVNLNFSPIAQSQSYSLCLPLNTLTILVIICLFILIHPCFDFCLPSKIWNIRRRINLRSWALKSQQTEH